jgi:hypothetical protein
MQVSTEAELLSQAAGGASSTPPLLATPIAESAPWFQQFASKNGVTEFARLVSDSDLVGFVEGSETPLTLFVPTNEAILAVTHKLPGDQQLLRELVCVHITLGSLRCALSPPREPAPRSLAALWHRVTASPVPSPSPHPSPPPPSHLTAASAAKCSHLPCLAVGRSHLPWRRW